MRVLGPQNILLVFGIGQSLKRSFQLLISIDDR
jgi:hypothetical protein